MNAQLIVALLSTVRVVLSYISVRNNGDRAMALNILRSADLEQFGLSGDALETARLGRAALTYLTHRGIIIDEIVELISLAEDEGRDVTTEEVQVHLDLSAVELEETDALISQM